MALTTFLLSIAFSFCLASPPAASVSGQNMDCKALSIAFPGKVSFPNSAVYVESTGSYFAAFENEIRPSCVIRPQTADEVSRIVKAVADPGSKGQVRLAIRGGGHTPWAGAANIEEGITLDLSQLTGIKVNPNTKICSIASGEKWANVYSTLGAQGLAVAGGRVSKVGVAGLITGGLSL